MNAILGFLAGLALAALVWLIMPPEAPRTVTVTRVVNHVTQEEVLVEKECPAPPPERQCIEPAYVLDLLKDCRAGRLDQAHPDITVRK
jgi:hypothetical protein